MSTVEMPWCDCKVAFGIDDPERFERWMDLTDDGRGLLPEGWSLCETDGAGARYVAIFRVEVPLTRVDGLRVERLLNRAQRLSTSRLRRTSNRRLAA